MPEDDTQPIYERLEQEPANWYARFLLYRNMKPAERSLVAAFRVFLAEKSGKKRSKPVKRVPGSWDDAFEKWDWKFRAQCYDEKLQKEQEARESAFREYEAAERERLLTTGLALVEKRIEALTNLFHLTCQSWIDPEEKQVEYKWVTPDKIREARGCLDDIAKELGHRIKKNEVTGKDGGPIEFATEWGGGSLAEDSEESGV